LTEIIWSVRALREHRDIVEGLEEVNQAAAHRIDEAITARVAQLRMMPRIGRPGRAAGTRELVVARTPYIVIYDYALDKDRAEILRVIHHARRWPPR
jgi:addiction module RelE/StbE family toxin